MLARRLRALSPSPPSSEIADEEAALEAAIERVEAEVTWTCEPAAGGDEAAEALSIEPDRGPIATPSRLSGTSLLAIAVVAAALGAGAYVFWGGKSHKSEPPPVKSAAQDVAPPVRPVKNEKDSELAPGVDGGASDPAQPYVFRRQPTFYRTLEPVGTIIVDKLQRFLYVVQPNNVAMRYGIAVGQHCADLAGLRHIASHGGMAVLAAAR